jgi:hypothetical protein
VCTGEKKPLLFGRESRPGAQSCSERVIFTRMADERHGALYKTEQPLRASNFVWP